jgi:hypothetical protein
MIINTEGDFIAPWHLAPKELVKEQGARAQWIYLTSTQFSYLKMLGKPTNSKQSTNTGYKLTCSLCQLVDNIRDFHKIYMKISTEGVFIAPCPCSKGASKRARCQRAMDLFDQYTIFISEDAGKTYKSVKRESSLLLKHQSHYREVPR